MGAKHYREKLGASRGLELCLLDPTAVLGIRQRHERPVTRWPALGFTVKSETQLSLKKTYICF